MSTMLIATDWVRLTEGPGRSVLLDAKLSLNNHNASKHAPLDKRQPKPQLMLYIERHGKKIEFVLTLEQLSEEGNTFNLCGTDRYGNEWEACYNYETRMGYADKV